jgi:hypothetical protein
VFSIRTVHLCGPRDHPISLLQASICGVKWTVSYTSVDKTPGDELWNDTEAAGMTIRKWLDIFQRFMNFWLNRAQLRIDCNGGPFQQLLQIVSNWPDAVIFTATKLFTYNYVIYQISFPRASCCHISLTKLLRPQIYVTVYA